MALLQRFASDRRGTAAMMFGIAVLPIFGLVGAALDYSRATSTQAKLQSALDLAALSIVKLPIGASQASIDKMAKNTLETIMGATVGERSAGGVTLATPTVSRVGKIVEVRGSASADTVFMQVMGHRTTTIGATSKALWSAKKIELALVLDNTGSMRDGIGGGRRKIDALKESAKQLLADLRDAAKEADTVKVSVVPFDTEVRLDAATYRSQPWFDWTRSRTNPARWTGYVYDRWNGYATSDAAPSTGIADSLFPAPETSTVSSGTLQAIRPLTSLYDMSGYRTLTDVVDGMTPRGNTNVGLGAIWGLATLTASAPFTEARPASDKDVKKFMVILTDGDNTQNWVNGAAQGNSGGQIDTRTLAACTTAKTTGVEVFTIRLVSGNAGLLRNCASYAENYFDVQNAGDLGRAFKAIVDAISGTRIAS